HESHEAAEKKNTYRRFTPRNPYGRWKEIHRLNILLESDKALQLYWATLGSRRRNDGYVSRDSKAAAEGGVRRFLQWLKRDITDHALIDLITETKDRHRNGDYEIDNQLIIFSNQNPIRTHRQSAVYVKGIFRTNHCPLEANIDNHYAAKTAKISEGILKAIYLAQDEETRDLIDYQACAGERIGCLAGYTGNNPQAGTLGLTLDSFEPYDERYSIVRIKSHQTKARCEHICIIPRPLAERITTNARARERTHPFPSYENQWRAITQHALKTFGVRLTSHYLRKRFATIAQRTPMPINSWDYLMGDRMSAGHEANIYTLEDYSQLVGDYDRHLAPWLSIGNPKGPDDPSKAFGSAILDQLRTENIELKEQVLKLAKLLTERV
ncbi:MAG TPA: hypothetical protein VKF15_08370, partial [Nitrososphaerales archaeon]|nr:hypothetical protein [Nitrososphaerales archaeon]